MEWIGTLPRRSRALDYGCGKLRYTIPLSERCKHVWAVDSPDQLDRQQIVCGHKSSVREYGRTWLPNVTVSSVDAFKNRRVSFDVALVTNVLSAIPHRPTRVAILTEIRERLREDGIVLVANQHSNSHFRAWADNPRAERYRDGWLVTSDRGLSFYGLIDPRSVVRHCKQAGLRVLESGTKQRGETAYALAMCP